MDTRKTYYSIRRLTTTPGSSRSQPAQSRLPDIRHSLVGFCRLELVLQSQQALRQPSNQHEALGSKLDNFKINIIHQEPASPATRGHLHQLNDCPAATIPPFPKQLSQQPVPMSGSHPLCSSTPKMPMSSTDRSSAVLSNQVNALL